MISKQKTTITYMKAHPIKSVVLGVFTLFTILGAGFGMLSVVAPNIAEALDIGPSCCGGGGWETWDPNPWININDPFPGGGGGGGSTPSPIIPACTLSVVPGTVTQGDAVSITWTSENAVAANIDNGIGAIGSAIGSVNHTPTGDTTYTMTVVSATGNTVTCADSVVVTPPVVNAPSCTLSIVPDTLTVGSSATISWTTNHGDTFSINNGVGSLPVLTSPNAGGTTIITPAVGTHTYTGTVTNSAGTTATCSDTITVNPVVVNAPSCSLTIDPTPIALGDSTVISWTTNNASTFSLSAGIGSVTPVTSGSVSVTPATTGTFTYVGVVTNSVGATETCTGEVVVTPPVVNAPSCTLSISPNSITLGDSTDIAWTTNNGSTFSIDNGIGSVTPVVAGDTSITPVVGTHTYTGTVTNSTGATATCTDTVTVSPTVVPPAPSCTLTTTGIPTGGTEATINWTIANAVSATLNTLAITPADGSDVVGAGTYALVVTGAGGDTETCDLVIDPPLTGFSCSLDIDKSSMRSGESATMEWETNEAASFTINGDDKDLNGTESISPAGVQTHTYTGIATNAAGDTVECSDTIQVTGGSGGGGLSCGMSFTKSSVRSGETSELRWTTQNAESVELDHGIGAVALNGDIEVRENGVGMHEYVLTARGNSDSVTCRATLTVSGGSGGCTSNCGGGGSRQPNVTIDFLKGPNEQPLAFVTLSQIPYTGIELGKFGTIIYWIFLMVWSGAVAYLLLFKILPFTGRNLVAIGNGVSEAVNATEEGTIDVTMHEEMEDIQMDGFSPKSGDEVLSVEDIVRGLSRMHQEPRPVVPTMPVVEVEEAEEVLDADIAQEMEMPPVTNFTAPAVEGEELRLLNALMSGDRDTSFSILRRSTRNGVSSESLIEKVLVSLDSAYRERVEGSAVSNDIRRMCAGVDTAVLEEIISALASAIDTTYSQSQTGAKLALARAHAIIERG